MKLNTSLDEPIESIDLSRYFNALINRFFKILPMKESNEKTLCTYIQSLQRELIGCFNLIPELNDIPSCITLLSILEYLCDTTDCPTTIVKTDVFHAINICERLSKQFAAEEEIHEHMG